MRPNLLRWGLVTGAFPTITEYREMLAKKKMSRQELMDAALGASWVARLGNLLGEETIKQNRPSWYRRFCEGKLPPPTLCVPEAEIFLGSKHVDMDVALRAGMGFGGYLLALKTPCRIDPGTNRLIFNRECEFLPTPEMQEKLNAYKEYGAIFKQEYCETYKGVLSRLYARLSTDPADEDTLERVAASGLILLGIGGTDGSFDEMLEDMVALLYVERMLSYRNPLRRHLTRSAAAALPPFPAVGEPRLLAS